MSWPPARRQPGAAADPPAGPPRGGRGQPAALRGEEVEAWHLARLIRRAVDGASCTVAERDAAGGVVRRPAGFDDFALLLRSTGNQLLYERLFRRFSIPYTTQNARSLFLEAPLYDFYQLLQLAIYPEDRLAYAALLRSPLVNVSDHCLLALLDGGGKEPFAEAAPPGLGEEDLERLALGRRLWLTARENADRIPLAELVDRLWAESGYAYPILRNPQNHNFLEYRDYLVRMAELADENGTGLAGFLDWLRGNLGAFERQEELELVRGRGAGVQILTIHRAKGLEFPVVVLADLGNRGRSSQASSAPFYRLPGYGFTFNLGARNWFARVGQEQEQHEEIAELKRLLYVGVTRARSHLVLSGVRSSRNRSCPQALLNMLLAGLQVEEPQESEDDLRDYRFRLELIEEPAETAFHRPIPAASRADLPRLAGLYRQAGEIRRDLQPQAHLAVTELARLLEQEEGALRLEAALPPLAVDPLLLEGKLDDAFGELTHELLQRRLLEGDPAPGSGGPPPADWLRPELAARFPARQLPAVLAEAQRLAEGFLASPLGRRALAAATASPSSPSSTTARRTGSAAGWTSTSRRGTPPGWSISRPTARTGKGSSTCSWPCTASPWGRSRSGASSAGWCCCGSGTAAGTGRSGGPGGSGWTHALADRGPPAASLSPPRQTSAPCAGQHGTPCRVAVPAAAGPPRPVTISG